MRMAAKIMLSITIVLAMGVAYAALSPKYGSQRISPSDPLYRDAA